MTDDPKIIRFPDPDDIPLPVPVTNALVAEVYDEIGVDPETATSNDLFNALMKIESRIPDDEAFIIVKTILTTMSDSGWDILLTNPVIRAHIARTLSKDRP